MARERLQWIDAARGFALALVALFHCCLLLTMRDFPVSGALVAANSVLDGFRMPTLLMISGILAASIREWPWRDVWRRRAAPLLLFYVLWGAVALVMLAVVLRINPEWDLLRELGLLFVRPHVRVWYFLALAVFMVLARALRSVPSVVVIAAAVLINVASYAIWPHPAWADNAQWWLYLGQHWVFFVCAERGARAYRALAARSTPLIAVCTSVVFAAVGVGFWRLGLLESIGSDRSAIPALVVAVLGTVVALTVFPVAGQARALAWARAIGRNSLGIYAVHFWVIAAVVLVAAPVLADRGVTGLGVAVPVGVTAVGLGLSFALTRALERWAPSPFLHPWWDISERRTADGVKDAPARAQ
ncbi:acyltransferase family protein [Demequina sp.]|uniref:acyltransferase family protein n=1 Tax=Demequina sp. TaxID=2050685 RepID=UPI003D0E56A0